jgi:hypothetical protein
MDDQKNLQKRHQADQSQIKMLQQDRAARTGPWRRRRHC